MSKFINPFTDWGFKKIFGQEITKDLLIDFLNELLKGERHITDLTFKDKERLGQLREERGIIYDIYCTTDTGEEIIVEMQNRYQEHFVDRSIYYASRAVVEQGVKGDWEYALHPVYVVCFLNYDIRIGTCRKFRTDCALMDMADRVTVSDRVRLIYLMLPLFGKNEEDECETNFERWIYVLKNMNTLNRIPFMARSAVFRKLAEIADISAMSKEDRDKYDESIKVMRDNLACYHTAEKMAVISVTRNMLDAGLPLSTISRCTGLSEREIEELRDN